MKGHRSIKQSKQLRRKASKYIPVDLANSIFIDEARGSHIWDVDGNEYIDYKLGWGPVILGHSHPAVQNRVHEYDKKGICHALDNQLEVSVAQKIRSLVPSAKMIRYFVSGTEATMHAIRIARAYTKKEKILKFEGHYHGTHDYALYSVDPGSKARLGESLPDSPGIPDALRKLVIINQWNDFDGVEKTVKKEANNIAAIIAEPIMANASVIPPLQGYLKFLRELCEKNNIVLIFDEVKTGFRVAKGGAQQLFGVQPHMTTFAKALGNGYPISAVVGFEEIMQKCATEKIILFHGTYARNPVSLAAADATLEEIKKGHVHLNIEKFGNTLMKGIREILHDMKIEDTIVQGYPSMFQVLFTKQERVYNYRDFIKCNHNLFTELQRILLSDGVMLDEYNSEAWYTSASHNNDDLEQTLRIFEVSLAHSIESGKKML